jgi:hypothetical protein
VGDALAELAARGPDRVRVLRMEVAGQRSEGDDVGLGDGPPATREQLADLQLVEGAVEHQR